MISSKTPLYTKICICILLLHDAESNNRAKIYLRSDNHFSEAASRRSRNEGTSIGISHKESKGKGNSANNLISSDKVNYSSKKVHLGSHSSEQKHNKYHNHHTDRSEVHEHTSHVFEGDMKVLAEEIEQEYGKKEVKLLRKKHILPPSHGKHSSHKGGTTLGDTQSDWRWTDRVKDVVQVPYLIKKNDFSKSEEASLTKWIDDLGTRSGVIKFVRRTTQANYILVVNEDGCWSYIGNIEEGVQRLSLDSDGCLDRQIAEHEFIHALGFWHEQSRPDRDSNVKINWRNIDDENKDQFDVRKKSDTHGTPYDFGSVMHYDAYAWSKNGKRTITPLHGKKIMVPNKASQMDIDQIRLLYQCKSGPRSLEAYKKEKCTSDCPCWLNANGCSSSSSCQVGLICKNSICLKNGDDNGGDNDNDNDNDNENDNDNDNDNDYDGDYYYYYYDDFNKNKRNE